MCRLTSSGLIPIVVGAMNHYWLLLLPSIETVARVLSSIQSAKASHSQLLDMPLRRDTQDLRLIASIPLIQRRGKSHSREGKSAFT